jgi:peptide-methionine (S)-S-oxide reductase
MEQLRAMLGGAKGKLVDEKMALPGRQQEMRVTEKHFVLGNSIKNPFPDNLESCVFATGWGRGCAGGGVGAMPAKHSCANARASAVNREPAQRAG